MGISRDVLEQLNHLLRPVKARIANSIARAVVQAADDSTKLQLLQLGVLAGEVVDDGERFGQYGFFSVPLAGAEAVVVFPNGDRGHPLVIATDDRRYRPKGSQPGEAGIYNHTGAIVRMTKDGDIEVTPAAGRKVYVRQPGGGAAEPVVLKSEYDGHTHPTGVGPSGTTTPATGTATLECD